MKKLIFPFHNSVDKINKSVRKTGWVEESFAINCDLQKLTDGKPSYYPIKVPAFIFIFFSFLLILRLFFLQVINGEYYANLSDKNRVRTERIEAKRGIIYDRHLNPLVKNAPNFVLYVIPADFKYDEKAALKASEEIGLILGEEIKNTLNGIIKDNSMDYLESYLPVFIADQIPYEQALRIDLKSENWRGLILKAKTIREYITPVTSLAHITGYTGKINTDELIKAGKDYQQIDYIGKAGIEAFWENELKGKNGAEEIEVNALGKKTRTISQVPARDGAGLVLAIDSALQIKAEIVLSRIMQEKKLSRASLVALDPDNGEVLALISIPSYDANLFARGISEENYSALINDPNLPLFNRAIGGKYPPGSTIKPTMSAAALQEGIITAQTFFLSSGGLRISEWFFPDWKAGGHGQTNIKKAIAESVNTFFYYIGGGYDDFQGLGVNRIKNYLELFGFGEQTGIDLPGEAKGFVPSKEWKEEYKKEKWYIGDTYHLAIGQGDLLATPLQIALSTAVFANGGTLYRPHIARAIIGNDGNIQEIAKEIVRSDFIHPLHIQTIREGMRQTVTAGSARSLSNLPFTMAGKTGTAQWSTIKDNHAWFTSFTPYENPKIVLTILFEEGKEGSEVAVPAAKEILNWYFDEK